MSTESDVSDAQVFHQLHALAAERFKQRAIAEVAKQFAGAPPRYMEQLKLAVNSMDQMARQLSAGLGHDPDKVDLESMARLRSDGLLTEEEISRFSANAQEEIKRLMDDPGQKTPF